MTAIEPDINFIVRNLCGAAIMVVSVVVSGVALHEISHTLGIGTHPQWGNFVEDGKWTGKHALAQLKEFDGEDAVLHADRQHFWPYGLNYDKGSNEENDQRFLKMVAAFQKDLGID